MKFRASSRAIVPACWLIFNLALMPLALAQSAASRTAFAGPYTLGTFVQRMTSGRVVCREASNEQAHLLKDRDANLPLVVLAPDADPALGLKIVLRGTPQLQSFPAARDAFVRAAARWQTLVRTRVTIIIDVDFGPICFGKPFDADVVSSADAQVIAGNALYPATRAGLMTETFDAEKRSLYNLLPAKTVPTDGGASQALAATSATLRAAGLLDPAADPEREWNRFGPPPAIAVNSNFSFDFEPSDGIEANKLDFEAIALHAIGHILGFVSAVGQQEMGAAPDPQPTAADLFRLRPDALQNDFAAATRVLTSGGEQRFYAGGGMLALSSGRPDGTGGDGQSPSHWKDDHTGGQYLGVMNPTIAAGESQVVTDNDLAVLEAIGYRTQSVTDVTTIIPLTSGQTQAGGMTAPPPKLGVLSHTHYAIVVPPGATQLQIDLHGDQDVDLFARYGQPVVLLGHNPVVDYRSDSESNIEAITITPASSLPLRAGVYYIAVANWGPGDASYTVMATVTGGASTSQQYAPAICNLTARLEGDGLQFDLAALDRDADLAMAEVTLLDEAGRMVRVPTTQAINTGSAAAVETQFTMSGLGGLPTAWRASVVAIDRAGTRSAEATVDFSKADSGALSLTGASFTGAQLTLKAKGLAESLAVEVNGRIVAPPQKIKVKGAGNKFIISGDATQLALRPGANRVRVRNTNGWSNILILNL
ncbi:MAG TPA: NF038122 family metalloprotease [Blastocatellia bacterium]|nr:NF038122 family metalloprotease [Blastocatellia bacterium]